MCACMRLLLTTTLLLQACIFKQPGRLLASVPGLDSKRRWARREEASLVSATAE